MKTLRGYRPTDLKNDIRDSTTSKPETKKQKLVTKLDIALDMTTRGYRVIPVRRNRKAILTWRKGADNSTADPETIKKWARGYPLANLAGVVEPGETPYAFLELDVHTEGANGIENYKKKFGVDPWKMNTYKVRSKSGGFHGGMKIPDGFKLPDLTGRNALLPGVEIVGGKRQIIILAGSIGEDGGSYDLLQDGKFMDMPDYLVMAIKKRKNGRKQKKRSVPPVGKTIPETERSDTLTSLGGTMRRRGMSVKAIAAALLAENASCCDPPLPENEVREIAKSIGKYKRGKLPGKLGSKIRAEQAAEIEKNAPPVPAPDLRDTIFSILQDVEDGGPVAVRRQQAGRILIAWLREHGGFVRSVNGSLAYYFYKKDRQLFNLGSNLWASWLYSLTGANPAGTDFRYLRADCDSQGLWAEKRQIVKVSYWDHANKLLYVSRFDGSVYRLDGETWTLEANGEHVLFDDDPSYSTYTPDTGDGKRKQPLYQMTMSWPKWDTPRKGYGLGYLAWIISTFFTELCPTRPIMALIGDIGSGKSMLLRMFLMFLFGPFGQVSGIPDKPDGFTAAAAAHHIMAIDNLDDIVDWLRDKLARLATGAVDEYRKLYSGNEVGRILYRCWLACSSHSPDTLRRADLSDRLLILSVKRIADTDRVVERLFLANILKHRNEWWGDLFVLLSKVIVAIKERKLSRKSTLRMADWESLGRVVAIVEGKEREWDSFIGQLQGAQSELLLEGDPIVDALNKWLHGRLGNRNNYQRKLTARELYDRLTLTLFGPKQPTGWYRNARSFSMRMKYIRTALKKEYGLNWEESTARETHNQLVYWFENVEKQQT